MTLEQNKKLTKIETNTQSYIFVTKLFARNVKVNEQFKKCVLEHYFAYDHQHDQCVMFDRFVCRTTVTQITLIRIDLGT